MGEALTKTRCVIFGGMISEIPTNITDMLSDTDYIICADKGYKYAIKNGIMPDLIIGDFDSSEIPEMVNTEIVVLPTVKDDTDFHFAAKEGLKRGYKDFLICGVTGGRIDHTLASFLTLNFLSSNNCLCKILDKNALVYATNSFLKLQKPNYPCYFSIFPLGEEATVTINGGNYEVVNQKLVNTFPLGVSNEFYSDTVLITVSKGNCIVLIVKKDM